jgi:hypothetical protein
MSHFERRCNGFESELHVGVVNVGDLISSNFGEELLLRQISVTSMSSREKQEPGKCMHALQRWELWETGGEEAP